MELDEVVFFKNEFKNETKKVHLDDDLEGVFNLLNEDEPKIEDVTQTLLKYIRILLHVADLFVGTEKNGLEIIRGYTFGGEKLSQKDKVIYALNVASGIMYKALLAYSFTEDDPTYQALERELSAAAYFGGYIILLYQKYGLIKQRIQQKNTPHIVLDTLEKFKKLIDVAKKYLDNK